MKWKVLDIKPL